MAKNGCTVLIISGNELSATLQPTEKLYLASPPVFTLFCTRLCLVKADKHFFRLILPVLRLKLTPREHLTNLKFYAQLVPDVRYKSGKILLNCKNKQFFFRGPVVMGAKAMDTEYQGRGFDSPSFFLLEGIKKPSVLQNCTFFYPIAGTGYA